MGEVDVLAEVREATRGLCLDELRSAREVALMRLRDRQLLDPTRADTARLGGVLRALTVVVSDLEVQIAAQVAALLHDFDPDRLLP